MAVGPVMLMQPSARQRRLAKLRQEAAAAGLTVGVTAWPNQINEKPTGLMRYSLPWPPDKRAQNKILLVRKDYSHEMHIADIWQKFPETALANAALVGFLGNTAVLPSVAALGFDGLGAFVDWNENNSSELEPLIAFLQQLRATAG